MPRPKRLPVMKVGQNMEVASTVARDTPIEGASTTRKETARWQPRVVSPDQAINSVKPLADGRAQDMVWNDGNARSGSNTFKDTIVGAQYRLNSAPNVEVLKRLLGPSFDEAWAEDFQAAAESLFNMIADSERCWLDAERRKTFTMMVRQAVGQEFAAGEALATAEWIREADRPFNTCVQMVSPSRLSNPNFAADDYFLRRGVRRDRYGRPISYAIQSGFPGSYYGNGPDTMTWKIVPAELPWGRKQVIHIYIQDQPDQSRGISDMVSVLEHMRMTKNFSRVTLQNAVVNASYIAAIESDLPGEAIQAAMGNAETVGDPTQAYAAYLAGITAYYQNATGIVTDGAKIPHLYPGTKLNFRALGTPGGVGTSFEESLQRHIAAGLNLSYEDYTRDFSKYNYSSLQASANRMALGMRARKRAVADRFATNVWWLWAEEWINSGLAPLPRRYSGPNNGVLYVPLAMEAILACSWIGAAVGQVDQLKESQAALLRIGGGLSTHEDELARLGKDWREVFRQRSREKKMAEELGLEFSMDATRSNPADSQQTFNQDTGGSNA